MPESIKQQLQQASQRLQEVSTSPKLDAELLLAHALDWPRSRLYARSDEALSGPAQQQFLTLLAQREAGRPLAYVTGRQEFWSLAFEVGDGCLVPRPETEGLVELALAQPLGQAEVLDLGTGSGCIAIALKHERPHWRVCAVDRSETALHWARRNAERLDCAVEFLHGRWFEPLGDRQFDLILSNPPYVAEQDPHLADLGHEPISALTAGPDGLDDLREIIRATPPHLRAGGLLALEHGYDQAPAVRQLLAQAGFTDVASDADLAGIERISHGRWNGA